MQKEDVERLTARGDAVLVSSRGKAQLVMSSVVSERNNICAVRYHSAGGESHYMISLHKNSFSHTLVLQSRVFVVNFISGMNDTVDFAGSVSGRMVDKMKHLELEAEDGVKIDCFSLKSARGFIECSVVHEFSLGDHTLFVGKILHARVREMRNGKM